MKKFMNIVAAVVTTIALSFAPFLSGECASFNFSQEYALQTYAHVEGTTIYAEEGVSQDSLVSAISGWMLIPDSVCEKLEEYNCNIYLMNASLSASGVNYGGYTYGARYTYSATTLEITGITTPAYVLCSCDGDIEGTVIHEIGHVLDFTIALFEDGTYTGSNCKISNSAEWQAIYAADCAKIAAIDSQTAVNSYSAKELFAEAFRLTYQNPEALIAVSPAAYEYVLQVVEQYTG